MLPENLILGQLRRKANDVNQIFLDHSDLVVVSALGFGCAVVVVVTDRLGPKKILSPISILGLIVVELDPSVAELFIAFGTLLVFLGAVVAEQKFAL